MSALPPIATEHRTLNQVSSGPTSALMQCNKVGTKQKDDLAAVPPKSD
jgi:hypothetical protein